MKILVVEDEKMIRKGIIMALKKINETFDVVEASNGKMALEQIDISMPDIVITDVRMPVMDGLDLVRELNKNYPPIWMIILSGYQDFSYAQQALKNGVSDYLIKPVGFEELANSLETIESKEKAYQERTQFHDGHLDIIRNEWLRNTMNRGNVLTTDQLNEGEQLNLHFQGPFYQVIAIEYEEIDLENNRLSDLAKFHPISWKVTENECGVILNKQTSSTEEIIEKLQEWLDQSDKDRTIGISPTEEHVEKLAEAYTKAVIAKRRKDHFGRNKIYQSQKDDSWDANMSMIPDDQSQNTIVEHAKQGNQQKMELYLKRQFDQFVDERLELKMIENWSVHLLIRIYMELHMFKENALYNEMNELKKADTVHDILSIVLKNVNYIMEDRDNHKQSSVKKVVDQSIAYMQEHFHEEITLERLAKQAFVSTTYLSKIFKKQMGISLVSWLNEYRIQKAKAYIESNQAMPMYLIAEQVGFNDYKYFIRVFKKETGFTPKEYKNK